MKNNSLKEKYEWTVLEDLAIKSDVESEAYKHVLETKGEK